MTSRPAKRASSGKPATPPEPEVITPEPVTVPASPPPPDRRAGGHVDRGDGRGWVLDEEEVD